MKEMATTRLYLIRHGATEENERGILVGSTDVPLSDKGRGQAMALARLARSLPVDAIFASPMLRTVETAVQVFGPEARILTNSSLRECHFGEWEGLYFAEIASRYPDLWQSWLHDWAHTRIPGGDDFTAFAQRLLDFCDEILNEYSGRNLAVVSHGGCIRAILSHYLSGSASGGYWKFKVENATLATIEFADRFPILTGFNQR